VTTSSNSHQGGAVVSASATFTGPAYYDDCLGPLLLEPFAADLARRLPQHPSGDVLEIACGTGRVTRSLRERLSPSVRLVATDVSSAMLDYAQAKLGARQDIEWRQADAMKLPFADKEFAAVVCGFGIMFMPDRQAALMEARRVLKEGGILLFNVWDDIDENPLALANTKVLEALFPGDPEVNYRFPYEMGDPGLLRELLVAAGFAQARIETKRISIVGADPKSIATGQIRGTARATMIEQQGISLAAVVDKVADAIAIAGGNPYNGQAQAVIVIAVAI
jgi:SAM-dependent methyltransferase